VAVVTDATGAAGELYDPLEPPFALQLASALYAASTIMPPRRSPSTPGAMRFIT